MLSSVSHAIKQAYKVLTLCAFHYKCYITDRTGITRRKLNLCIHGSVHRNSIGIRSNKMQPYAGIYLLQNHSTCFGCPSHPSSEVHKIVTAASGTGHSI